MALVNTFPSERINHFAGFNEVYEGFWNWEQILGITFRWSHIWACGPYASCR